jgi:glycerol-3-phosphate dehydrogenase
LLKKVIEEKPEWSDPLHADLPIKSGEVIWAVRHEMARTVEDFLARRRRVLFQDARKSIEVAPKVAAIMAEEIGHDAAWQKKQVESYTELAKQYLVV